MRLYIKGWINFIGLLYIFIVIEIISLREKYIPIKFAKDYADEPSAKKDWHDYKAMHNDNQRIGIGEQGEGAKLDNVDRALEQKMFQQHGLNALLSDAISVNRSVPDVRDKGCLRKTYLAKLPTVSIVIPFYNEYLSTFTRTLHSLINRTPPELLKEIILVDDVSDPEFFAKLRQYVADNFDKVIFVRLPERMGLIRARLAGARKMTAEVLVVLDAHIEVNYNWLPPLLEPIALNRRTVVCPIIDGIDPNNFKYYAVPLARGGFDWRFTYKELDLENFFDKTKTFENPVMMGGLFAIALDYFWELGGYDEDLDIWGGEQFELSFKIWMCGGRLINVPCSRVAHHFRSNLNKGLNAKNKQYWKRNTKRVAEVWMDEYKTSIYTNYYNEFEKIDAGDLTERKALREKLHCKSFKWYMNEIAFDFLKVYPAIEPPNYAYGAIQSVASPNLCVDTLNRDTLGLYPCSSNLIHADFNQKFKLTLSRDLRWFHTIYCLDVPYTYKNVPAPVTRYPCHGQGGTQFWYYDRETKWLNGREKNFCLEAIPSNFTLHMNTCQKDNLNMKWNFGYVNHTALDRFFENITI